MPKKKQKLHGRNPTDPMLLARAVVEAAIGEPYSQKKALKRTPKKSKNNRQ